MIAIARRLLLLVLVIVPALSCGRRPIVIIDFSCPGDGPQPLNIRARHDVAIAPSMVASLAGGLVVHVVSSDTRYRDLSGLVVDAFPDSARMAGPALRSAVIDSGGFAVLDSIAPGPIWLRSRAIGFRPSWGEVTIRPGALDTLFLTQELDYIC